MTEGLRITPRAYQQEAHDAVIGHWQSDGLMPCLVEMPTGSGKSIVVAMLAETFRKTTGKRVLCIQPSKELTEQNGAKFGALGGKFCYYSASVRKDLSASVVYCTPLTIVNKIEDIAHEVGAIIIDEAHVVNRGGVYEKIVDACAGVPVVGLTATPYRTDEGYIFRTWPDGKINGDAEALTPFFSALVHRNTARDMLGMGHTCKLVVGDVSAGYDTSSLSSSRQSDYSARSIKSAVERGDITEAIIGDVLTKTRECEGVLVFAASVAHARQILEFLPASSAMITGTTRRADRERIVERFKARAFRYLVSVGTLTTGFDATHVDAIAILRPTKSPGLYQQMVGRGSRNHEGKPECVVYDYTAGDHANLSVVVVGGDLYEPKISDARTSEGSEPVLATCPACGVTCVHYLKAGEEFADYELDEHGYFVMHAQSVPAREKSVSFFDDTGRVTHVETMMHSFATGETIVDTIENEYSGVPDVVDLPGIYTRSCKNPKCDHRWDYRICKGCGAQNDIAARVCRSCKRMIIDPGDKLALAPKLKKDLVKRFSKMVEDGPQTSKVRDVGVRNTTSGAGNPMTELTFFTDSGPITAYLVDLGKPWTESKIRKMRELWRKCGGNPTWVTWEVKKGFNEILDMG